jgi:hypothetical protein
VLTALTSTTVNAEAGLTYNNTQLDVSGSVRSRVLLSSDTSNNLFIGRDISGHNADMNTLVGQDAGLANTTGRRNTFLGYLAGNLNFTANNNTFLVTDAGQRNTTGSFNTFVGSDTGESNIGGGGNTLLGFSAGTLNDGSNNIFIGLSAGSSNTTGNGNIFIGASAGTNATYATRSNRLVVGNSSTNQLISGMFDSNFAGNHGINGEHSTRGIGDRTTGKRN